MLRSQELLTSQFEAQIRTHYKKYDAGVHCFNTLGANTKIYVRAEEDNVRVALDVDRDRAWKLVKNGSAL